MFFYVMALTFVVNILVIIINDKKRYVFIPICLSGVIAVIGYIYFVGFPESFLALLITGIYFVLSYSVYMLAGADERWNNQQVDIEMANQQVEINMPLAA